MSSPLHKINVLGLNRSNYRKKSNNPGATVRLTSGTMEPCVQARPESGRAGPPTNPGGFLPNVFLHATVDVSRLLHHERSERFERSDRTSW